MNLTDAVKAEDELKRALATRRADTIARAAFVNVWPLFSSHHELLMVAIESLPHSTLTRHPTLQALHPMTPVLARRTKPFKPLVYHDDARAMDPDELDLLTLVQMIAFRFSGDIAAAVIYAQRLEDRILRVSTDSRSRTDGPLWYYHLQIGSTHLAAGDSGRALREFATARQLGRISLQADAERLALGCTALAHAVRGSLEDAELALAEALLQPPPSRAHVDTCRANERAAAALVGVERMADDVDELLAGLEPYDSTEPTWPLDLLARTRSLMARHRPAEALEAVRLAADAHSVQQGSFAGDVIRSMSIESLWAVGDPRAARRQVEVSANRGVLTSFAAVRLALHESRWTFADHELRRVVADPGLGPAQHAESVLLSAWLEIARTDELDASTARQIGRLAATGRTRRLLTATPEQLIILIRPHLSPAELAQFDTATSGLSHVESPRRPVLTNSELRVLNALPVHGTTAAVAAAFHVSPNTIKSQLKSVYRKLGCSTRDEAITIASRLQLMAVEYD